MHMREDVADSIGFRAFIFILLAAVTVFMAVALYRLGDWPWGSALASTYSGYSWGSAKHLTAYDTTTQPRWTNALDTAASNWNQSPYVGFVVKRVEACPKGAKICIWEMYSENDPYYAYTIFWTQHGHIRYAKVVLNDAEVDFEKEQAIFDRTLCHELGHVLGLSPDYDPDSCMGGSAPHPSERDYAALAAIYGAKGGQ